MSLPRKGDVFGGEDIPVFVPAAGDPRRTKFRRAASARSRDEDVDVFAPKTPVRLYRL